MCIFLRACIVREWPTAIFASRACIFREWAKSSEGRQKTENTLKTPKKYLKMQ